MKILFLSQGCNVEDQLDFDIAFRAAKVGGTPVEVRNIPFIGYSKQCGEEAFYKEVLRQNEDFKPDLIFCQFYHSGGDAGIANCCRALKSSSNSPHIFGSIGDPFWAGWRKYLASPLPKSVIDLARYADAFFATSFGNVADGTCSAGQQEHNLPPSRILASTFPILD